jgi:hypothetical protein
MEAFEVYCEATKEAIPYGQSGQAQVIPHCP